MNENELLNHETESSGTKPEDKTPQAGRGPIRFKRGAYTSKDKPIRILDACIAAMIIVTIVLTVWNAVNGGFVIEFDAGGADHPPEVQKVRHGELIEEPVGVVRPGYTLKCWTMDPDKDIPWNFAETKVGSDLKLRAVWEPAQFEIKFDLAGGSVNGADEAEPLTVTYGSPYGELPVPQKEGSVFAGWEYSGDMITADTVVSMTGEHLLTAKWN